MSEILQTPSAIPDGYGCSFIFREFKHTWIHENKCWLNGRMFTEFSSDGIPAGQFSSVNGGLLEHYLNWEWPQPNQGARWYHNLDCVEVFADDLYLCPKCGEFTLTDLGDNPFETLGLEIEGERTDEWHTKNVTIECSQRLKKFFLSRLAAKEFLFKECDDEKACEESHRLAMRRIRRDYGSGRKKELEEVPPPPAEIEKVRKEEKPPWDEGYIYLIRCGEFYKIGLSKDARKRVAGLKTSSPHEVELLKSWQCKNPFEVERGLHKRFAEHRVRGEWFKLPEGILKLLLDVEDLRKDFAPDDSEFQ